MRLDWRMANKKKKPLQTRIEAGAYKKLRAVAKKEGRSLSSFLERLIYETIDYTPKDSA